MKEVLHSPLNPNTEKVASYVIGKTIEEQQLLKQLADLKLRDDAPDKNLSILADFAKESRDDTGEIPAIVSDKLEATASEIYNWPDEAYTHLALLALGKTHDATGDPKYIHRAQEFIASNQDVAKAIHDPGAIIALQDERVENGKISFNEALSEHRQKIRANALSGR